MKDNKKIIKKTALMVGMASILALNGCSNNYQSSTYKTATYTQTTYKTNIEKIFEPGTHIVEIRFEEIFPENDETMAYVGVPFDIPEGYELFDFETNYYISGNRYHLRSVYVFINTKTVKAIGRYDQEYDKYIFSKPGTVVDDLSLKLK